MVTFDIAEGNPGALTFLMLAYQVNPFRAEICFRKMQEAGVTGARLYMLWNDCCNRNAEIALKIMETKDTETIKHHIDGGRGRGIPFDVKPIKIVEKEIWE